MEHLPLYITIVFVLTALTTLGFLYRGTNYSKPVIIITLLWLVLQSAISLTGFYTVANTTPPRFALLLFPPVIFIVILFFTKSGRAAIDSYNVPVLTLLSIIRIPVEITLYWLFIQKMVPGVMTFEGRNFDIFGGITVPFIYYFGYVKNAFGKKILIAWNILCLLLLVNVVITAVLSAPSPFQKFGFGQPNIAIFYFPFTLLPGLLVPIVFFTHLTAIRRLVKK
jgi:hypothetical protein